MCDPLPNLTKSEVQSKAKHLDPWKLYRDTILFTHGEHGIPPLFYGKILKTAYPRHKMTAIAKHVDTALKMLEKGHVRVLESVVYLIVTLSVMVWGGRCGEDVVEDVLRKRRQIMAAVAKLRKREKKPLLASGNGLKVTTSFLYYIYIYIYRHIGVYSFQLMFN